MEIIIEPETLRNELKVFQNLVLRDNATMEISNLLLETTEDGRLFIYGTDMDVSLRTEVAADLLEIVAPGRLALKAHKLIDMLGTLDSKVRSLRIREEENGWASVLFGRSHFKITGIKADLFPAVRFDNYIEDLQVTSFPAGLLHEFLGSTAFAVSGQDTKYALTGTSLTVDDTTARAIATDGFRIAVIEAGLTGHLNALVPKKAGAVLIRLLEDAQDWEEPVTLSEDSNAIYATLGKKHLVFRKLAGEFPDVRKAIPQTHDYQVLFDLADLRGAVRRADLFAEKNNHSPVTLTIRNGEMEVSARSFEEGSGNEVIDAVYEGEEKKIKIGSRNLVNFFNSVSGQATLAMSFSDNEKVPTVWRVAPDGAGPGWDYQCVITRLH